MNDRDLLVALLAVHNRFATAEDVLEAVGSPALGRASASVKLARLAGLAPREVEALRRLAALHVKRHGGDAAKAATAVPVEEALRSELAARLGGRTLVPSRGGRREKTTTRLAEPADERYVLKDEIARGGIGRVMEAHDRTLDREVAVKLVLDEASRDLRERFAREARLTARLDHPSVVPIHDFGEMEVEGGERQLFLCMKRIRGRDLDSVLRARTPEWTRPRLLNVFQDVCLGMAYAHSKGVIHRDLKPGNVMVGDFGEVMIVDWGLAKELGGAEPEAAAAKRPAVKAPGRSGLSVAPAPRGPKARRGVRPALTMDGEILGTPAYMPPEQADGRLSEMDARSDIWSLGAILWEILTGRPPFEGSDVYDVLAQVARGQVKPPSSVADVPAELDAICLKAMALERADRFGSALDLHREVQLFLEGIRERERSRAEARERAAEGRRALERWRALRGRIAAQDEAVEKLRGSLKGALPVAQKRPLWNAETKRKLLADERVEAATQARSLLAQALAADPSCDDAREGQCELCVERFLEAEERGDREGMLQERLLLSHTDATGAHRARLAAPGRLEVRGWEWTCDCLRRREPWTVRTTGTGARAWRDGRPRDGEPVGERDRPVPRLVVRPPGTRRGHGPDCPRRNVEGAQVFAAPYAEKDRRLVAGPERRLGTTPLRDAELPQGTWRCAVRDGAREVVFPVLVRRGETWTQDVNFYDPADVPAGFLLVPGGPFLFGSAPPARRVTEDVFVARAPVTCGEFLEFLNALAAEGALKEAREAAPLDGLGPLWEEKNGIFRFPASDPRRPWAKWRPDWPVLMVSWHGAVAYSDWKSSREGRLFTLLHEEEWEKAARGTDGRLFPYGNEFDSTYSHTVESGPPHDSPEPAGSFPLDESPYGIRGLSGGVATWCLNRGADAQSKYMAIRGGSWIQPQSIARSTSCIGWTPDSRNWAIGFRLACRPHSWQA